MQRRAESPSSQLRLGGPRQTGSRGSRASEDRGQNNVHGGCAPGLCPFGSCRIMWMYGLNIGSHFRQVEQEAPSLKNWLARALGRWNFLEPWADVSRRFLATSSSSLEIPDRERECYCSASWFLFLMGDRQLGCTPMGRSLTRKFIKAPKDLCELENIAYLFWAPAVSCRKWK